MRMKAIKNKDPKPRLFVLGVLLALAAGFFDVLTDNAIFFVVPYLLPIMMIAWYGGGVSVALIASLCGIIWLAVNVVSEHIHSHVATTMWEGLMVLCFFLIVGYSVTAMKFILQENKLPHK